MGPRLSTTIYLFMGMKERDGERKGEKEKEIE
jgi:hypothetical protein